MKKIKVKGTIVGNDYIDIYRDFFEMDATAPKDIENALPENGEDVLIEINSYGGYVNAGNQIYQDLINYEGKVTVDVIMAGSAASVIAMAGDTVRMTDVGQMMIHNVSSSAAGDYRDMDKTSEILKTANSSLANAYVRKTGLDKDFVLDLMNEETWLEAKEAVDFGFADEMVQKEIKLVASHAPIIPESAIEKIRKKTNLFANVTVDTDELVDKIIEKLEDEPKTNSSMLNKFIKGLK